MLAIILQFKVQLQREEGQDLVEYGLLAAFISVAAIAGISAFGQTLLRYWNWIAAQLALAFS